MHRPVLLLALVALVLSLIAMVATVATVRERFAHEETPVASPRIPLQIWTYWNSDPAKIPDLIRRCIQTWRDSNPGYRITVLSDADLTASGPAGVDLTGPDFQKFRDNPARFSDLVRLHVLARHGGIWMDASIICTRPLDWVQAVAAKGDAGGNPLDLVAYYTDYNTDKAMCATSRALESWFLAAPPGSRFVVDWRDEFLRMRNFPDAAAYTTDLRERGVQLQGLRDSSYHAVYHSAQRVLQAAAAADKPYSLHLIRSDDTAYKPALTHGWGSPAAAAVLAHKHDDQPIIKLTKYDRTKLEEDFPDYGRYFDELARTARL